MNQAHFRQSCTPLLASATHRAPIVQRHLSAAVLAITLAWPLIATGQTTQPIVSSGTSLPAPLGGLVDEALTRFTIGPEADEADEERELRRAERAVLEVLATEGYFEPTLRFEPIAAAAAGGARYRLIIELGRRTTVGAVDLKFTGALSEPRFPGSRGGAARRSGRSQLAHRFVHRSGKPRRLNCWPRFRRATSPAPSWSIPKRRSTRTRQRPR